MARARRLIQQLIAGLDHHAHAAGADLRLHHEAIDDRAGWQARARLVVRLGRSCGGGSRLGDRPGPRNTAGLHYVVFAGMPGLLAHEGRMIVEPSGAGTKLRWEVDFRFRSLHWFRMIVPSFIRQFEAVLQGGVTELKRQLEASP
jgi:hypothetical protein